MNSASQLPLSFELKAPAYVRENFVLSQSNADVMSIADRWTASGEMRLVICGPEGAGKTHLAHIIAESAGEAVKWFCTGRLGDDIADDVKLLLIDDAHCVEDPKHFFPAIKLSREKNIKIVFVGRGQPVAWAHGLKDLETRLEAMPRITMAEPDENLLQSVIHKLFKDRQLKVDPAVITYAVPRLPRTFAAARAFVAAADATAAEKKGAITKLLAGNVINNLSEGV